MADYHRFVAYIYEYVNGKKMQNTGFAKIELRNAICRIQIHIQNIRMLDGKTEVFGIVRQPKESRKNNPIILLIGEGQTQGSGFDRRFTVPEEPFVEESCRFEQVCGIYIRSQSGRNWMTVFDDEPIAIEKLGKPEEIKAETDEENVQERETDKEAVEENETDKENVGIKENEKSEKSTESEADQELQEENINLDITEHAKAEPEITAEEMQEEIFSKEVAKEIPEKVPMKDISEKRLSDYMAEQIADEILSGRIPGGSQLKQEELAEAFEASRIPIREAFQILENQGLIIRLATRRITVTELDEEQICLIYSMISEMTKKALNSLKHSKKTEELYERLTTPGLLGEVQPAEAMCDLVENEYIKRLLRNASDSYIRFALSTGRHKEEIKEERNKLTELLKNGELKKAEKALDAYFKLLAKAVNEERGMNE